MAGTATRLRCGSTESPERVIHCCVHQRHWQAPEPTRMPPLPAAHKSKQDSKTQPSYRICGSSSVPFCPTHSDDDVSTDGAGIGDITLVLDVRLAPAHNPLPTTHNKRQPTNIKRQHGRTIDGIVGGMLGRPALATADIPEGAVQADFKGAVAEGAVRPHYCQHGATVLPRPHHESDQLLLKIIAVAATSGIVPALILLALLGGGVYYAWMAIRPTVVAQLDAAKIDVPREIRRLLGWMFCGWQGISIE
ncbi:hypothetical protein BC831DRAFT_433291 [Entophlyctis helioformis]|nr:hypothetical protein BC831DRAFT_433291 [Entophlyctis helioformis]